MGAVSKGTILHYSDIGQASRKERAPLTAFFHKVFVSGLGHLGLLLLCNYLEKYQGMLCFSVSGKCSPYDK